MKAGFIALLRHILFLTLFIEGSSGYVQAGRSAQAVRDFIENPPAIRTLIAKVTVGGETNYLRFSRSASGFFVKVSPTERGLKDDSYPPGSALAGRDGNVFWGMSETRNLSVQEIPPESIERLQPTYRNPMAVSSTLFQIAFVMNLGLPLQNIGNKTFSNNLLTGQTFSGARFEAEVITNQQGSAVGFSVAHTNNQQRYVDFGDENLENSTIPRVFTTRSGSAKAEIYELILGEPTNPTVFNYKRYANTKAGLDHVAFYQGETLIESRPFNPGTDAWIFMFGTWIRVSQLRMSFIPLALLLTAAFIVAAKKGKGPRANTTTGSI